MMEIACRDSNPRQRDVHVQESDDRANWVTQAMQTVDVSKLF